MKKFLTLALLTLLIISCGKQDESAVDPNAQEEIDTTDHTSEIPNDPQFQQNP